MFWLQRLQPVFFTVAVGSLIYQVWLVGRRPPAMRTTGIKTILAVSLVLNAMLRRLDSAFSSISVDVSCLIEEE